MEYLNSIDDNLTKIDESNIEYFDLFEFPELFYGNLNFSSPKLDFSKFPKTFRKEIKFDAEALHDWNNMKDNSCGNRLRFTTSSSKIIFKIKLRRKWPYRKLLNWNAMGFDVYILENEKYIHKTIFAPIDGKDTFAEYLFVTPYSSLCIFLPTYDVIEKFIIGFEKNSSFSKVDYPKGNQLPIIFYGNSVTQGAAASKSGNIFPNIVSRKLNRDIINISCSLCCRGNESIAQLIGKINCHSIIVDYTRNAASAKILSDTHELFYERLRDFHPDKKIILMTSACFNYWRDYDDFDNVVIDTYNNALDRGDNVALINQRELFNQKEYDYVAIDTSHYSDYGMFKIANKLVELLCNDY
ncbi:SGNH/GDSL hydrolase family protein [Methanobrevibacter gottschalkii]|uniref:SGNH/GDSL hydrolase family protein n=1 Tax=Methanobrevibacter gottschalkii TaxID=190974 RepID=UPI0038D0B8B1